MEEGKEETQDKEKRVNLVIKSNIRKALRGKIDNVADEVEDALEEKVLEMLEKGVERAKANQRKTLQARDL